MCVIVVRHIKKSLDVLLILEDGTPLMFERQAQLLKSHLSLQQIGAAYLYTNYRQRFPLNTYCKQSLLLTCTKLNFNRPISKIQTEKDHELSMIK